MRIFKNLTLILATVIMFNSCQKEKDLEKEKSTNKEILTFNISSTDGDINESEHTISLTVPYGTDVSALQASISISSEATIYPKTVTVQDFSSPVTYTVTAEDGSKQDYIATITVLKSSNCSILEFSFANLTPLVIGVIDESTKTISLKVPKDTDVTVLVPTIITSEDAIVNYKSGEEHNFSSPVKYTLTAQDGSKKEYSIVISFLESAKNAITEFMFEEFSPVLKGIIDQENKSIKVLIPWNAKLTTDYDIYSMTPSITVSEDASIDPLSGSSESFNFIRTFTVSAENGDQQTYSVDVSVQEAPLPTVDLSYIKKEYKIGDYIEIKGTNFTPNCYIILKNKTFECTLTEITETSMKILVESSLMFRPGNVNVILKIRGVKFDLGTIKFLPPPASFTQFSTSNYDGNNILTIRGTNFSAGNNKVYFVGNGINQIACIEKENNETFIYVIIPPFIPTGEYNIKLVVDGQESTSTKTVGVIMSTEIKPVITGVNKTTIAGGETLEIYGKNFTFYKNIGERVNTGWMDNWSSTKNIYGTIISDEKIEVVIDRNRLSSDNKYSFYLDFFWPKSSINTFYNIQIID